MLSDRGRQALLDIRDNILMAQSWTANVAEAAFAEDRMRVYAVTRCLQIISEASRRLPPEVQQRHPHIQWREMRDAAHLSPPLRRCAGTHRARYRATVAA
jgi:uncharacterized protein with HEPN domain